ncbi:MAG: DUF4382 domain-containing protein [Gemmatimonadales bacterium]
MSYAGRDCVSFNTGVLRMVFTRMVGIACLGAFTLPQVGCGGDIATDPRTTEQEVRVTLQVASPGATALEVAAAAPAAKLMLDAVASLRLTVTGLDLHKRCEEGEEGTEDEEVTEDECEAGGWQSLTVENQDPIDFMALPTEGQPPIIIAAGTVAVGEYDHVRLFVTDEVIVFLESFTVGQVTYDADVEIDVEIPSGAHTGIKTDLAITVAADGEGNVQDVGLLFDPDATFNGVVATGSGTIKLPPVLRAR